MMNRKIAVSALTIFAVAAAVVGATTAFYSDTETSTGNTLAAGAIDLAISNESYYNGVRNPGTSWSQTYDLDDNSGPGPGNAYLYLNFNDLKPGDWGEDTIDLEVHDNDAWACVDVTLDTDDENVIMEPELDMGDTGLYGELADAVDFIWWKDDGDNVLEDGESLLPSGPLGVLSVGGTATMPLADSTGRGVLESGALVGERTYYIGKAWCFGEFVLDRVPGNGGQNPSVDPGFTCDGSGESNITQSDSLTATISFRAEQERNNPGFTCRPPIGP